MMTFVSHWKAKCCLFYVIMSSAQWVSHCGPNFSHSQIHEGFDDVITPNKPASHPESGFHFVSVTHSKHPSALWRKPSSKTLIPSTKSRRKSVSLKTKVRYFTRVFTLQYLCYFMSSRIACGHNYRATSRTLLNIFRLSATYRIFENSLEATKSSNKFLELYGKKGAEFA